LLPQAFPLFLRARDWMRLLDGSTAVPFYDRHPDGGLVYDSDEDEDPDGTSIRIDLGAELDAADEGEEGEEGELSESGGCAEPLVQQC
jgi:hypothetical protein